MLRRMDGSYDEALERLHRTGPEYQDGLSNHGPMAVDALTRMGRGEDVARWTDRYLSRLEVLPTGAPVGDWAAALGDRRRLGDWLATFERELADDAWEAVLERWWPRLLPGIVAGATHGVIRTGHAVRALREQVTDPRRVELGQALASWAARFVLLPAGVPRGPFGPDDAYDRLPVGSVDGRASRRAAALGESWSAGVERAAAPRDVLADLDALVDAAVSRYAAWAPAQPTMLVHLVTAPRAVSLVLPSLPTSLWAAAYDHAWRASAAIATMYRPAGEIPVVAAALAASDVPALAARCGDEHAIKLSEVALESYGRGNPQAAMAATLAIELA
jgi:hypothetical protein